MDKTKNMSPNGVEILQVDSEGADLIEKVFSRRFASFNGTLLHETFANRLDDILNMEVRDEDVWVCSFPKAGTTWTQEMVWCVANNLDFDEAKKPLSDRYIFLDTCFLAPADRYVKLPDAKKIDAMLYSNRSKGAECGPRFIKTHLPYDLLPKKLRDGSTKAKVVCVSRNPRDACISSFHHRKMMGTYRGDLETYCDMFIRGLVTFGPYWKHLFSYWKERNSKNLVFIKFEDMKENLPAVVNKIAKLFGKQFDKDGINALCEHLSFENMKMNAAVNSDPLTDAMAKLNSNKDVSFLRKGAVDQWKSELSQTVIDRFEKWESENLQDTNLTYINL